MAETTSPSNQDRALGAHSPRSRLGRVVWLRRLAGWSAFGLWLALAALIGGAGALVATGRAMPLPNWALAQIESRLNAEVRASLPGAQVAIEKISLSIGAGFAPNLVLTGAELRNLAGRTVLALPTAQVQLSRQAMLAGEVELRALRLSGASIAVTRDLDGQMDIAFAAGAQFNLGQVFDVSDQFFDSPLGRDLHAVEVDTLNVSFMDMRSGQRWELGEGKLSIARRGQDISAQLGLRLLAHGTDGVTAGLGAVNLGRVDIAMSSQLGSKLADVSARLSDVLAQDVAAQIPVLAFMSVVDAPLSGEVSTRLTPSGLSALRAELNMGAGRLAPIPVTGQSSPAPIGFDAAKIALGYDPANGRLMLNDLQLSSEVMQLSASGHATGLRADGSVIAGQLAGEWPSAFALQLKLDSLRLDNRSLFQAPVVFSQGQADMTLQLAPFSLQVHSAQLQGNGNAFSAKASLAASSGGWQNTVELDVPEISAPQLLALWPQTFLRGTRAWLASNLHAAQFSDVSLRIAKDADRPAQMELGYHFQGMQVSALRSLPPITDGAGYGAIRGNALTMVLNTGRVTPPDGGDLNLAGTVFSIPDIRVFPATGNLRLQTNGALTATLSLIDQPPFRYLTKAGRAVDFAAGQAKLTTVLTLPLQRVVTLADITLQVTGQVTNFASSNLAKGHVVAAPKLRVFVTKEELKIEGDGDISGVGFRAAYHQPFGNGTAGKIGAKITGQADLSNDSLRAFGVILPDGIVSGQGLAQFDIDLAAGQTGALVLSSDLRGIDLRLGAVGYRNSADAGGALRAEIALSSPPQVTALAVTAGALQATGTVRLAPSGGLEQARFDDVNIGKWFAGEVIFAPQGSGRGIVMRVPSGTLDMRFLPNNRSSGGAGAGMPISVSLDRLRVSDGITLTGFQGDFRAEAEGLRGNFAARVARRGAVQGQLAPSTYGTQIRLTAQEAGAVLAGAEIFASARGGQLEAVLTPQATAGHYLGTVNMAGVRVQSSSILAELLNAISVVGLLDQLGGAGILFNNVSGQFLLTPKGVELREGVATGGSLGVTMAGTYGFAGAQLRMQGVISPIYLINGVGAVVSGRGEGVLGFNYNLRGTSDAPQVQVNPLSVLLPGFLRNLFKAPPAKLE